MTFDRGRWYLGWQWGNGERWFYPFNWLKPEDRYWGREDMYYDGPLPTFGLWFFNVSWFW